MPKRVRYADVYNDAFVHLQRKRRFSDFVRRSVQRFCRDPQRLNRLPGYMNLLVRTQSIVAHDDVNTNLIAWSLRVARFVERRAARTIVQRWLEYLYRPSSTWLRRTLFESAAAFHFVRS